jgi:para-nitrobenzyl esterase
MPSAMRLPSSLQTNLEQQDNIMRFTISLPVALLFISAAGFAADVSQPIQIESGLIQGVPSPDKAVVAFKGIPYAAPPVGALRWREPQPPAKWDGVRLADKFGACCPQVRFGSTVPVAGASEDCLYLNVWVPAKTAENNIPILFFVHGGCYQFGSGNMNGEGMARKGIIFISVNHRLGNFCSMGHPALTKESPLHACGNYGSLDLLAALKWIHGNIAAFGGDPGKITIAGQSTGASNVHYLTTSPLAKGLFRGVIAISFPYDFLMKPNGVGNMWQAEQSGLKLAKEKNLNTIEELRQIPAADLLKGGGGPTISTPVYPLTYSKALDQGLASDVPTLTGLTADDFTPPAKYDKYTNLEFFKKRMAKLCAPEQLEAVLALYPAKTDAEAREMWKLVGNEIRLADTYYWAKRRAKTAKTPAYTYIFTQAQPMEPERGAYHGSDMFYEFNDVADPAKNWRDEDRQVAEQVSAYWVNFVKTGNPNGPNLPEWKAFDPNDRSTMILGKESGFRPITGNPKSWELLLQEKHQETPGKPKAGN